jgi:hypothetical protein
MRSKSSAIGQTKQLKDRFHGAGLPVSKQLDQQRLGFVALVPLRRRFERGARIRDAQTRVRDIPNGARNGFAVGSGLRRLRNEPADRAQDFGSDEFIGLSEEPAPQDWNRIVCGKAPDAAGRILGPRSRSACSRIWCDVAIEASHFI